MPSETKTSPKRSRKVKAPANKFVDIARELGLDDAQSVEAFERAMQKIAPPKAGPLAPCGTPKPKPPDRDDKS